MSAPMVAPPPARSPWQRLYGVALATRRRKLAARAERLAAPVISVGNLHWGGTGKTPFTMALAAHLRARGHRPAVLSRGYGRASRGPLVVSTGAGPVVEVAAAGDEPYLMAAELTGVAVVVGERRAEAGRLALRALDPAPDLFVLDDGFSHVALARDLELLLFPAADPFAGGRLLPAGRLREPLAAARGADAVVLTDAAPGGGAELARVLAGYGYGGPGFAAATVVAAPVDAAGAAGAFDPRTPVLAVAGIARPERFFAAALAAGVNVVRTLALGDHSRYSERQRRAIASEARAAGARAVLTTAKDRAKLAGRLALPLAVLPIESRPEAAFWSWLDGRLAELGR